jgi:hypothetical protein
MGKEPIYYEVTPRIVPAGKEISIRIRPMFDHVRVLPGEDYHAVLYPMEGTQGQMRWAETYAVPLEVDGGELVVHAAFPSEQEYALLIRRGVALLAEFRLYALDQDLYRRRPYKGDFHMHTYHSDGIESPAYVAGACRRIGMDFMAITDHRQYAPSLEAIRAYEGVDTDLQIFPGEEVHPPGNPVHILNFGGNFSVNALFDGQDYQNEVQAITASLENWPEGLDSYPYASCVWSFDKIRAGGGLAIFCHPYWVSQHRYDVPVALTDQIFARQPYDALELIGGYHRHEVESNLLQVARYHEERSNGRRIPIVGVSDSHGCETGSLFGWYYTIVFAESRQFADLTGGIQDLYSVAVEALPGEIARTHGPFRMARYAQFLLREFYPLHDELCVEEGRLMIAYTGGDTRAAGHLHRIVGRVDRLAKQWWEE